MRIVVLLSPWRRKSESSICSRLTATAAVDGGGDGDTGAAMDAERAGSTDEGGVGESDAGEGQHAGEGEWAGEADRIGGGAGLNSMDSAVLLAGVKSMISTSS